MNTGTLVLMGIFLIYYIYFFSLDAKEKRKAEIRETQRQKEDLLERKRLGLSFGEHQIYKAKKEILSKKEKYRSNLSIQGEFNVSIVPGSKGLITYDRFNKFQEWPRRTPELEILLVSADKIISQQKINWDHFVSNFNDFKSKLVLEKIAINHVCLEQLFKNAGLANVPYIEHLIKYNFNDDEEKSLPRFNAHLSEINSINYWVDNKLESSTLDSYEIDRIYDWADRKTSYIRNTIEGIKTHRQLLALFILMEKKIKGSLELVYNDNGDSIKI
ncbi:MAG: hypothetical protein R3D58_17045 [Saprospiraceae bacterium]